ncbi:MAG: urease accessory protein [Candidatus Azotimanducaceae bacterium]
MTFAPEPHTEFSSDANVSTQDSWVGKLELEFKSEGSKTRLTHSLHQGPLRVQRAFQETDGSCHVYLLHPPGGVVAGDVLDISVLAEMASHCVLTTPAAGKFYRVIAGKKPQVQRNLLRVDEDSLLEWLPQETIFFRGTNARMETHIQLGGAAQYIGWEICCLGRRASGEKFDSGSVLQALTLSRDGKLLHRERLNIQAGVDNPLQSRRWGLAGQSVFGTLVAALPLDRLGFDQYLEDNLEKRLMALLSRNRAAPYWGVTLKSGLILVRYLGDSSHECRAGYVRVRNFLLRNLKNIDAVSPRVWAT